MPDSCIETHGLRKRFGDKLAVADLSLSVQPGEVFGFLGPNGAGKTTSLKMLLGLIAPTAGTGTLLGKPLGDRAARAKVGFLPEHFRFQDWLTGRELLRFHGRLFGLFGAALERRVEELLARVDLLDAAHRTVGTYSKGMTQRVGLAQALLNHPRLVFLDEPTSGLDPIGRLLVRDVIHELRTQGTAVFLNSHLLGEVEATCDRVVFVKQGRVLREMRLDDASAGIEVVLRTGPLDTETREGLNRFGEVLAIATGAMRVRVAHDGELPELARWLVSRSVDLYSMSAERPSLEATFLAVMGEDQGPG